MNIYSRDSLEKFYQAHLKEIVSNGRIAALLIFFAAGSSIFFDFFVFKSMAITPSRIITMLFSGVCFLTSFSSSVTKNRTINTGLILLAHLGINLMNIYAAFLSYTDPSFPKMFKLTAIFVLCVTIVLELVFSFGIRRYLYLAVLPPALVLTFVFLFSGLSSSDWLVYVIYPTILFITLIVSLKLDGQDRKNFFANQLDIAKNVTKQEAKLKDEFISNVRHELRTPLNGIVGIHHLLGKTDLNADQKNLLEMAVKSSSQLSNMIEELLDISTMDQRTITLKLEELELFDFTESVFKSFEAVGKKSIDYRFNFNADKDLVVTCDIKRLFQVLNNLLGNSEKFTAEGMISLDIDCISENDRSIELRFAVNDTGIGVPQDKLIKVFDRFFQVDSSTSKKFKGTGLGLAISKRIIESMGGKICCNSMEGQGSVFFFVVKLNKSLSGKS